MSRVHDMGGQTGFGPVPVEDEDGRFFHADWEARVYALVRALQRHKIINPQFDELRDAIERIPPAEYLALSYYERWLCAAEILLAEKGLLPDDQDHGTGDPRDHADSRDHADHRDHGDHGDHQKQGDHRDHGDHGDHQKQGDHRDHGDG
jgi:nitrile hydratase subunit beta